MKLADKTVIVTGAAGGIGRAIAHRCAREGAVVVVADIEAEDGEQTVTQIENEGGTATSYRLDVTDADAFDRCVSETVDRFGPVDALLNNAGTLLKAEFTDTTSADLERLLAVNVWGVWNGCQAVVPVMREAGSGAIVNTSSIRAFTGAKSLTGYGLSKGAVQNFTRTLAAELGPDGIRVNAICPGSVDHGMRSTPPRTDEGIEKRVDATPLQRLGDPDEMAAAAVFLASDDASFVTGQALAVDGGRTLS